MNFTLSSVLIFFYYYLIKLYTWCIFMCNVLCSFIKIFDLFLNLFCIFFRIFWNFLLLLLLLNWRLLKWWKEIWKKVNFEKTLEDKTVLKRENCLGKLIRNQNVILSLPWKNCRIWTQTFKETNNQNKCNSVLPFVDFKTRYRYFFFVKYVQLNKGKKNTLKLNKK